jgi:hypothetical protein
VNSHQFENAPITQMPTVMLTVSIAVALGAELARAAADLTSAATNLAGARSLNSMTLNERLLLLSRLNPAEDCRN